MNQQFRTALNSILGIIDDIDMDELNTVEKITVSKLTKLATDALPSPRNSGNGAFAPCSSP